MTLQAHSGVSTHSRVCVFSVVCGEVFTQRAVPFGWQEFLGMRHPSPGTIRFCVSEDSASPPAQLCWQLSWGQQRKLCHFLEEPGKILLEFLVSSAASRVLFPPYPMA